MRVLLEVSREDGAEGRLVLGHEPRPLVRVRGGARVRVRVGVGVKPLHV